MKDILQNWLEGKLGIIVDIDTINQALKDGTLLLKILKQYGAINTYSINNIIPTEDDVTCKNNLTQLRIWFKLINIDLTDDIIMQIIAGDYSVCINILYQLYLAFEKNIIFPFVGKQKERTIAKQCGNKFKVSKLNLSDIKTEEHPHNIYDYSSKVLEQKHLIEWYEDKYDTRKKKWTCPGDKVLPTSSTTIIQSEAHRPYKLKKSIFRTPSKLGSIETKKVCYKKEDIYYVRHELGKIKIDDTNEMFDNELCKEGKRSGKFMNINPHGPLFESCSQFNLLPPISSKNVSEYQLPQHVKAFMKKLRLSSLFSCNKRGFRTYSTSGVSNISNLITDYEKSDLKNIIAYRLLKQSTYEKDLTCKLLSLRKQHEVQKKSYSYLENLLMKAKSVSLSPNLRDMYDDSNDDETGDNYKFDGNREDDEDDISDVGSSYFNNDRQRFIFDNYFLYYQSEKKRTVELHRKLYAEKLKLRFERHYSICLHTLEDLIDLSIRQSEFKKEFGFEVPSRILCDWKCLFHCGQPIFDVVDDLSQLLSPDISKVEVIVELGRQDVLNEHNLDMYLKVKGNWDVPPDRTDDVNEVDLENKYSINDRSQIILGYVVHRMLESKYPLPPKPTPPDILKFPIMAVVNGITNVSAIETLKNLFEKAGILVFDMNTAVNFCLKCFKSEVNADIFSVSHEVESEVSSDVIGEEIVMEEEKLESVVKGEFTQTASSLFESNESNPELGVAALLGCDVLNLMLLGNELPFNILVDIIIHYIRHHEHKIKGWVLVNFPSTLFQASIIEHILTGKKFPYRLEDDLSASSGSECKISKGKEGGQESIGGEFELEVKNSKIVPNPRTLHEDDTFKTYFTLHITMVKGEPVKDNMSDYDSGEWEDNHSESTLLLEQPEKEGVPSLRNFYQGQGIGYDFIYERFDLDELKQLVHVILLNYIDESQVPTEILFSDELIKEFEPAIHLKWIGPYSNSVEDSTFFKSTKAQSISIGGNREEEKESVVEEIKTGSKEDDWHFTDLPVADNAGIVLAAFWETLENVYLNGLKHAFFVKRNTDYTSIPYIAFITKQIHLFMNRLDDRQKIVTEFLDAYNNIYQILRSDSDMKNELHLRIIELKRNLTQLCLEKCDGVQQLRKALINQNWTYQEMALYTNCYITLIQLEVDRCLRTFEFLQDYYLAMLNVYNGELLPSIVVSKIDVYVGNEVEESEEESEETASEENDEVSEVDSVHRQTKISINLNPEEIDDVLYKSVITRMLNYDELKESKPLFCEVVKEKAETAFQDVLKVKKVLDTVITREEESAIKKQDRFKPSTEGKDKIVEGKDKKSGKPKGSETAAVNPNQLLTSENKYSEDKERSVRKLFDEWRLANKNEVDRLSFRIDLLKRKSASDFILIEEMMGKKFSEFSKEINERFLGEIVCIDRLCELFQFAIEEKAPIKADLIFMLDEFYAVKITDEKPEHPLKLPTALEEMLQEGSFTVKQLDVIKERLFLIAPSGTITREAFVQFIQSIIYYSSSHDNIKLVPATWNKLRHNDLEFLLQNIFGNYNIIEWRDFLLFCLELPFPLTEDIVDARLQFAQYDPQERELVTYENYMKTTLWYQRELPDNPFMALHNILAKEFIFHLFKTCGTFFNYMTFLMTFCKDVDPKVGFGKGLSLFLGRGVIVYEEDLFLEEIMTDHLNTEFKIVNAILLNIIDDVVNHSMTSIQESAYDLLSSYSDQCRMNVTSTYENNFLTEDMYYQYFKKFSVLRWTSKVPNTVIMVMLFVVYFTIHNPEYVFLYPDVCNAVRQHMLKFGDEDIYVPDFVNTWWLDVLLNDVRKFTAFSLSEIIKKITNRLEK